MVNYVILNEAMKNYKYTSGPSHPDLRVLPVARGRLRRCPGSTGDYPVEPGRLALASEHRANLPQSAASLPATRGVTNHYAPVPASFAYKA
jgi:hypothetical protein